MNVERKSESGYVIVTVAVLLVVLVGFTALAVDVGTLLSERASSQRAADAGALAGAFTFIVDADAAQPDTAILHARQVTISNSVLGNPIQSGEVAVDVDIPNRRVTVTIERQEPTIFAKALSITSATVKTRAVAEAGKGACGARCVKPFFVPNTILSTLGANSTACDACTAGQVLLDSARKATQFAKDRFGTQVLVHSGSSATALGPGDFYSIDIPTDKFPNGCTGGDCYREAIRTCLTSVLVCQKSYSIATGKKAGPTKQGVEDLIGNPPTDTYVGVGKYRWGSDGKIHDTSKALVIAPIWDACNMPGFCPAATFPNGTQVSLQIIGFAMIFIESVAGSGDVTARLVWVTGCDPTTTCGTGGGDDGNENVDGSSVYAIPLRLVHLP